MTDYRNKPTILVDLPPDEQLTRGILDQSRQLGWRVISLTYSSSYIPSTQAVIGAITSGEGEIRSLSKMRELGVPMVTIQPDLTDELQGLPQVLEDRHAAGLMAADSFAERGFKDVAYIEYKIELPASQLCAGIRQGTARHGCNFHLLPLKIRRHFPDPAAKYEMQIKEISEWLQGLPRPLGVFAFNNRMGTRIVSACEVSGLAVPEQVAVLSRGDDPVVCEMAAVPLSAIDTNPREQGRQLVLLLKRLVDGENPPTDPILVRPKGIIARRSTDIFAVSEPEVALALRYIWDYLDRPLSVDDIAAEFHLSRSTLERKFRRCLGRGVNAELRRKRLERCKELLRSTDKTLSVIMKQVGFNDRRYFFRAFKKEFGLTPKQYRKKATPPAARTRQA